MVSELSIGLVRLGRVTIFSQLSVRDRHISVFAPNGVFQDGRFNGATQIVNRVDLCCHGNKIWASFM